MNLNENQRRCVSVTLRMLEERLAEVEWAMEESEQGILYHRVAGFTPKQRERMGELVAAIRGEIRRAAEQFQLPVEEQSAARYVISTLSLAWESLEDIRPRKLKSYGAVDPALKNTLDPILQNLIRWLFSLDNVVRGEGVENDSIQ